LIHCSKYPLNSFENYKYVVVLSRYQGQWLFSKHRQRSTWETQGGHIEPGETPIEAARRELYEESGALEYTLRPCCDYQAGDEHTSGSGVVFVAEITRLGPMPAWEMERVQAFDGLPADLTYPEITPHLFEYVQEAV
jgi:8-oxo-dGTP diphosphatase